MTLSSNTCLTGRKWTEVWTVGQSSPFFLETGRVLLQEEQELKENFTKQSLGVGAMNRYLKDLTSLR